MPINTGFLILVNDKIRMFAEEPNMETSIPERKPPLIGLITIHKKLNEYQAQSRFAGRKPALHW